MTNLKALSLCKRFLTNRTEMKNTEQSTVISVVLLLLSRMFPGIREFSIPFYILCKHSSKLHLASTPKVVILLTSFEEPPFLELLQSCLLGANAHQCHSAGFQVRFQFTDLCCRPATHLAAKPPQEEEDGRLVTPQRLERHALEYRQRIAWFNCVCVYVCVCVCVCVLHKTWENRLWTGGGTWNESRVNVFTFKWTHVKTEHENEPDPLKKSKLTDKLTLSCISPCIYKAYLALPIE